MRWWLGTLVLVGCPPAPEGAVELAAPSVDPGTVAMRRLTTDQYHNIIGDLFGSIAISWRLEPDRRESGLLAVGARTVSVTPAGFEDYEAAALGIAKQALSLDHRGGWIDCEPENALMADEACAEAVLWDLAPRLFRRPITDAELDARVALATQSAVSLGDFWQGLEIGVASLLIAPEFVFRVEEVDEQGRLTAASIASRLSFLLWNAGPDQPLLDDVASGAVLDSTVYAGHVDRLIADERFERGVRALFSDLYHLDELDHVRKDTTLFPQFNEALISDSREQTLLTVVDHLVHQAGDYRDLYTTRDSFLNRPLGLLYQVPVTATDGFEATTFSVDSQRSGVLSHVSLMSLLAHPGRSSPTLRGKFVREVLLCETVPPPPADVDFSVVEETNGELLTARERLAVHQEVAACASCHTLMDPLGLGLENFDALGVWRDEENGETIDVNGDLDGETFDRPAELAVVLSEHPGLAPCFVDATWRTGTGRDPVQGEVDLLGWLDQRFVSDDHQLAALFRRVALSDGFTTGSGPLEVR